MSDKNLKSDERLAFALALLLGFLFVKKIAPPSIVLVVRHKYIFAVGVSLAAAWSWTVIRDRIKWHLENRSRENQLFRPTAESLRIGVSDSGSSVYLPIAARTMHAQVVGTTNAGKTESVILPWAISDIEAGRGLILIDGKSDRCLLDKLYAYCAKFNRTKDFRLLSLVNVDQSSTFNPLVGGTPEEVVERVFGGFTFENEYYRNEQFRILKNILILFDETNTAPTFQRIIEVIQEPEILLAMIGGTSMPMQKLWVKEFTSLAKNDRQEKTSGLVTQLGHFATGESAELFNSANPQIDIEMVMREGLILYCQLPVLRTPMLGRATGKMLIQTIQSAISTRHLGGGDRKFFGIYLDDFTEYLTPGFVSILNKSRSANVGITFAHQAVGDLATLGAEIKNSILTNANLKVFMRTNEPESAEYFARTLGTGKNVKLTRRQKKGALGDEMTGEASVRDVEEFTYHPNLFKSELGVGEAAIVVPFSNGSSSARIKFEMRANMKKVELPSVAKEVTPLLGGQPSNRSVAIKMAVEGAA